MLLLASLQASIKKLSVCLKDTPRVNIVNYQLLCTALSVLDNCYVNTTTQAATLSCDLSKGQITKSAEGG